MSEPGPGTPPPESSARSDARAARVLLVSCAQQVDALARIRRARSRWAMAWGAIALFAVCLFLASSLGMVRNLVRELRTTGGQQLLLEVVLDRGRPEAERVLSELRPVFEQAAQQRARQVMPRLAREIRPALAGLAAEVGRETEQRVRTALDERAGAAAGPWAEAEDRAAAARAAGRLAAEQTARLGASTEALLLAMLRQLPAAGEPDPPIAQRWRAVGRAFFERDGRAVEPGKRR